ncbi:MAG: high light inducible protein [Leptolyngbya foveolarum]|uniref:High light inducible protein n=1 Tax=Leptolyngbya foveolarum TaxID=47253 RepID=A0A2W4TV02_9CYAN|nr:MAG: high light inducible protein [Leptolyngbya foveolarum]
MTTATEPNSNESAESTTLGVNATRYYRPEPRLGFTPYAELWNGRLAMVGLVIATLFEVAIHLF